MRGLHGDRGHLRRPVETDAGDRPARHPARERRGRQGGEQLGGGGTDIAAAVAEGLLQELLVRAGQAGPQRVEEHQPVLRPFGGPGGREEGETGRRVMCPYGAEQGDPLGEQALVPQAAHTLLVPGVREGAARARAAQGEPPLGVEPGQPQAARPGQLKGLGPQIGARPGRVEEGGQGGGRRPVTPLVGEGEPLREQFGQVGRGPAPPGGRRRGPAGEQLVEPPPRRPRQRPAMVLGRGLRRWRGGPGSQSRPASYGVQRGGVEQGTRQVTARQTGEPGGRPAVRTEQGRGGELLPDAVLRGFGRPGSVLPEKRGGRRGRRVRLHRGPPVGRCSVGGGHMRGTVSPGVSGDQAARG